MIEQPFFGRRLKELRQERSLSQAALAGDEISTGYLSRLESGSRQPTDRVLSHLAERLGVDRSAFDVPPSGGTLAQALSIAASTESDEAISVLIAALKSSRGGDQLSSWQGHWLVFRYWQRLGHTAEERASLDELVRIADELSLPELQCRSWAQSARLLRSTGDVTGATDAAHHAYRIASDAGLSVADVGFALQTLVAAEAEAGRLPDARAHVDELVRLTAQGSSEVARTEALWTAATVRSRQGDHEDAREYLELAMVALDSRRDLTLWARLRLAAASLYLQDRPPQVERGRECLRQAETALSLVGTSVLLQELRTLQAYLAFYEGRYADSRSLYEELVAEDLLLVYRDQVRLGVLDARLLLLEGHEAEGLARLKQLGEEGRQRHNMDLAADIWRILAEALEDLREGRANAPA